MQRVDIIKSNKYEVEIPKYIVYADPMYIEQEVNHMIYNKKLNRIKDINDFTAYASVEERVYNYGDDSINGYTIKLSLFRDKHDAALMHEESKYNSSYKCKEHQIGVDSASIFLDTGNHEYVDDISLDSDGMVGCVLEFTYKRAFTGLYLELDLPSSLYSYNQAKDFLKSIFKCKE